MNFFWAFLHQTYRVLISPLLHLLAGYGCGCRYQPTCSHYMLQSIQIHGPRRGALLGIKRILRCQPFSSAPHLDPVPSSRAPRA